MPTDRFLNSRNSSTRGEEEEEERRKEIIVSSGPVLFINAITNTTGTLKFTLERLPSCELRKLSLQFNFLDFSTEKRGEQFANSRSK